MWLKQHMIGTLPFPFLGYRIRSLYEKVNETQGLWKTVSHTSDKSACFQMNSWRPFGYKQVRKTQLHKQRDL